MAALPSSTPAASTVTIISLAGQANWWAHVDDSGFVVFRDGRLLLRSGKLQRCFNCPVSLKAGWVTAAEVGEAPARAGDVVVVDIDGLFDDEVEQTLSMGVAQGFSMLNMAEVIAAFAHEAARCTYKDTPYGIEKWKQKGATSTCGKPDNITVVVTFIVS